MDQSFEFQKCGEACSAALHCTWSQFFFSAVLTKYLWVVVLPYWCCVNLTKSLLSYLHRYKMLCSYMLLVFINCNICVQITGLHLFSHAPKALMDRSFFHSALLIHSWISHIS